MRSVYERSVFIGDLHIPYEDKHCVQLVLNFISWFHPHFVFIVGDCIDMYQLSVFDKQPDRALQIGDDIKETRAFLSQLRAVAPRAEIIYFEGNHEDRLRKFLWKHPEIAKIEEIQLPSLLHLADFNIKLVGGLEDYDYHNFQIEHGGIIRKHSAYTAKGQMEARGTSGISGHSHRMGSHFKTNRGGDFVWYENGCLCDRNPEYVKHPDWQNGFTVGYFKRGNSRFTVEQICITGGKLVYAGREFS